MQFYALTTLLAISSVSGLAVPNIQNVPNTEAQEASTTTSWIGVESTAGFYPGPTPPERSVPNPNQPFLDVSSSPTITAAPPDIASHWIHASQGRRGKSNAVATTGRRSPDTRRPGPCEA